MADTNETPQDMPLPEPGNDIPPEPSPQSMNLGRTLLEPINKGYAAATIHALSMGVPAHAVVEMQMNHIASTIAQLEPAGLRLKVIEDVVRQISSLVRQHVDARNTTQGGIILPRAGV